MAKRKIKHTKNELKRQRDELARFERFLPTLKLKKQQLLVEIQKLEAEAEEVRSAFSSAMDDVSRWVGILADEVVDFTRILRPLEVKKSSTNIAGVDIPVFEDVEFHREGYDLFETPLWVDAALERVEDLLRLKARMDVLEEAVSLLREELRVTTQRVNLFEKVKIPEAKENIRIINIFLGDEQVSAVVRGKIAKKKIARQVQR